MGVGGSCSLATEAASSSTSGEGGQELRFLPHGELQDWLPAFDDERWWRCGFPALPPPLDLRKRVNGVQRQAQDRN